MNKSVLFSGLLNCRIHKKAEFKLISFDCDKQPVCHGGAHVSAELSYRDGAQRYHNRTRTIIILNNITKKLTNFSSTEILKLSL